MPTRTVLIFAKPPRTGLAKTRLAATAGRAEARRIAHMTMARTLRAALDPRWQTRLYAAPDSALSESLGGIWPAHLPRFSQGHGDLGARLQKGLDEAPRGQVVFLGADTPDISPALIWRSFRLLARHDAVFGPASDGGFWLLAVNKRLHPARAFAPVRWSGPHAMSDLAANLDGRVCTDQLPVLIDLDEAADWKKWRDIHRKPAD